MTEEEKKVKYQEEARIRSANFLLQMIEKYGAEILREAEEEKKSIKHD